MSTICKYTEILSFNLKFDFACNSSNTNSRADIRIFPIGKNELLTISHYYIMLYQPARANIRIKCSIIQHLPREFSNSSSASSYFLSNFKMDDFARMYDILSRICVRASQPTGKSRALNHKNKFIYNVSNR